MAVICANCGGPHPKWECKKAAVAVETVKPKPTKDAAIEKPKFDRVAYQKAYMAEYHKRRRVAKNAAKSI